MSPKESWEPGKHICPIKVVINAADIYSPIKNYQELDQYVARKLQESGVPMLGTTALHVDFSKGTLDYSSDPDNLSLTYIFKFNQKG